MGTSDSEQDDGSDRLDKCYTGKKIKLDLATDLSPRNCNITNECCTENPKTTIPVFVSPIKAVQTNSINKKVYKLHSKKIYCAVIAQPFYDAQHTKCGHRSNSSHKVTLWRVLLDIGSDGDLLFERKGSKKPTLYCQRKIPQIWHTSNGIFNRTGGKSV